MPWYHNTDAELNLGDEVLSAAERNHHSRWAEDEYGPIPGYSPHNVYMYNEKADPSRYTDYGKNRYEVEPIGNVSRDPEFEYNKDSHMEELEDSGETLEDESNIPGYHNYVAPHAKIVRKISNIHSSGFPGGL
jgi:hypothetical protein